MLEVLKWTKERKLWARFVYVMRVCTLPEEEFNVDPIHLHTVLGHLYHQYAKLFKNFNCTYNTHVMLAHLDVIRQMGPLTKTSAFRAEGNYSSTRRHLRPGVTCSGRHIMRKKHIAAKVNHCCKRTITVSPHATGRTCNYYFYCYDKDNRKYDFYRALAEHGADALKCKRIATMPAEIITDSNPVFHLDFADAGVFLMGEMHGELLTIRRDAISGKAVRALKYIMTVPNGTIYEL